MELCASFRPDLIGELIAEDKTIVMRLRNGKHPAVGDVLVCILAYRRWGWYSVPKIGKDAAVLSFQSNSHPCIQLIYLPAIGPRMFLVFVLSYTSFASDAGTVLSTVPQLVYRP